MWVLCVRAPQQLGRMSPPWLRNVSAHLRWTAGNPCCHIQHIRLTLIRPHVNKQTHAAESCDKQHNSTLSSTNRLYGGRGAGGTTDPVLASSVGVQPAANVNFARVEQLILLASSVIPSPRPCPARRERQLTSQGTAPLTQRATRAGDDLRHVASSHAPGRNAPHRLHKHRCVLYGCKCDRWVVV